jgi:DNA recombination protein Rad52
MTFTEAQKAALAAPLDRTHVAQRKQGGGQVSYIEAWHAIAEANQIFGFDGWNRETLDLRQLGDPREVNGKIRVDYSARVRITVGDITRDGCGFGQGIDKDVGQAHESALKEAETDAMKRALMTFGNPFGLALYDKTQANVADAPKEVATITDDQRDIIAELAESAGVTLMKICETAKIASLPELPAAKFESVISKLKLTIASKQKEPA